MNIAIIILFIVAIVILGFFLYRKKIIEGMTVATQTDIKNAWQYALEQLCKKRGYEWKKGEDGTWDCTHTKDSCLRESKYPIDETNDPGMYLEWRDGKCIMGNVAFRDFCEKENLVYDPSTGQCRVTQSYCNNRLLPYCNNDCYNEPTREFAEQLFGTTIGRVFGAISPLTYKCPS